MKTKQRIFIYLLVCLTTVVSCTKPGNNNPGSTPSAGDVTNFTATPGLQQVVLGWAVPANADIKEFDLTYTPGGTTPIVISSNLNTYTVTGLTGGMLYTFTLKTKNSAGNSSTGVTESATPTSPTNLKFSVVDNVGNSVPTATINLYQSQSDYTNNTNVVATQVTDNNGTAIFSNLNAIVYYYAIYRSSDCSVNTFTTNQTSSALTSGVTNTLTVVLNQRGQINFVNSSSNPYYIYINGSLWNTVNGGATQSVYAKIGTYALEVKQVSGYAVYPTDEKSNVNVTACSNTNVSFP